MKLKQIIAEWRENHLKRRIDNEEKLVYLSRNQDQHDLHANKYKALQSTYRQRYGTFYYPEWESGERD